MSESDWKPWSEETCHLDQKIGPEMTGREITSVHSGDAEFQACKRADMIRQAMGQMAAAGTKMCLILEEAHEARDWIFLGYRGFRSYAEKELGLHHSHAYRLLEYARCIKALAEAGNLPVEEVPALPERQVRRLGPVLTAVTKEIRERCSSCAKSERPSVVAEIVTSYQVSSAGDTKRSPDALANAVAGMVTFEQLSCDAEGFPVKLAEVIDAHTGRNDGSRLRWSSYLAEASAELQSRITASAKTKSSKRKLRKIPTGLEQATIFDCLGDSGDTNGQESLAPVYVSPSSVGSPQ